MTLIRISSYLVALACMVAAVSAACGTTCETDEDCFTGGFIECGKCNLFEGTEFFKTCYDDSTPSPTPAPTEHNVFPEGGQCKQKCKVDSDCELGGFNPCGVCGKFEGTETFELCYQPAEPVVGDANTPGVGETEGTDAPDNTSAAGKAFVARGLACVVGALSIASIFG